MLSKQHGHMLALTACKCSIYLRSKPQASKYKLSPVLAEILDASSIHQRPIAKIDDGHMPLMRVQLG